MSDNNVLNLDKSGNLALNLSVIKRLDPETTHVCFPLLVCPFTASFISNLLPPCAFDIDYYFNESLCYL